MKKKLIATFLIVGMVAGSLAGCGGSSPENAAPVENGTKTGETAAPESAASAENGTKTEETAAPEAAAPENGEQVTIRFAWWGGQDRADKTNKAVELFMEKNPDIKVETSFYPFESYNENLSISASAGNMPDVFQGFVGSNNDLMEAGLVEPLDDYINQGLIDTSDISESLLESAKIDGKTYGVSLGCNVKCLIVDPEAYEKAGLTVPEVAYESWDALGEDLRKLKEAGLQYGGDDMFERGFTFPYFCRQNGETEYSSTEEKTIAFSKDTYVNYYNYKLNWIQEGLIPPYDVTKESSGPEDSQIAKGNSAVRNAYSNQYAQIAKAAGKDLKLILLPGPNTDKGTDVRPGCHACMASTSEHKEAAAKLINFLINDIDGNKILDAERGMPASAKVREALKENFTDAQNVMADAVSLAEENSSLSDPAPKGDVKEIDDTNSGLLEDLEQQMIYGEITPEEAYQQISDQYGPK